MNEILSSTPFLLFLVLASYLSGTYIYTKSKIALLQYSDYYWSIKMGRNRLRDFFQRQLHDTFHVRTFCRSIGLCFIRTNRIFKRKSSIHHFFYYCRKFSRDRKRNLDLQTNGSRT